jgi:hypothetical protein
MSIPQLDVEFDKRGNVFQSTQLDALVAAAPQFSDLIVLSHGWNNDKADAGALYQGLLQKIEQVASGGFVGTIAGRTFGAMRIFWPSKRFTDEELIPGGGAASAEASAANEAMLAALIERLKNDPDRLGSVSLEPIRVAALERIKLLVPHLETSRDARREFVLQLRGILDPRDASLDDASIEFFSRDPAEIFDAMSEPVSAPLPAPSGGAADAQGGNEGGAASLRDLLGGTLAAARRVLNFTTYYEMKERAGMVGRTGVATALRAVRQSAPNARNHLVGHSFGGRVVTAAANELDPGGPRVSLMLIQAAFSHNGLAVRYDGTHDGAFRRIVSEGRVSGPIIITHTKNDRAVGVAYPLASRMAFQKAAALGDENDPYGGMGRNGAQQTPEAKFGELKGVAQSYPFGPGGIFNLKADRFVKGHSDIVNHEIAYAFLTGAGVS